LSGNVISIIICGFVSFDLVFWEVFFYLLLRVNCVFKEISKEMRKSRKTEDKMKKTKQQQQLSNSRKQTRRHCPDFESSTSRKRRWDIL